MTWNARTTSQTSTVDEFSSSLWIHGNQRPRKAVEIEQGIIMVSVELLVSKIVCLVTNSYITLFVQKSSRFFFQLRPRCRSEISFQELQCRGFG
mmetsp:Transcript_46372/g.112429  ORF Transcript_46372/g.112429 Transcript_46372/m.112429 type:complete len:94 (-) Transcript_46372:1273-1554(-)